MPAVFGGEELAEWGVDVVAGDVVVGDVDVGEDRLVELAAGGIAGVLVELVGVLEEVKVCVEVGASGVEVVVDVFELFGEAGFVSGDAAEPFADAFLREGLVGGEVEQVVFFDGELGELVFQLFVVQALGGGLVVEGSVDTFPDGGHERRAEADRFVVFGNGVFDSVDAGVGGVAGVVLGAAAEEVAVVGSPVSAGGAHQDHAPVDAFFEAALSAPDGAFEVVVVASATFGGVATGDHEVVDFGEEVVVDEAGVAAGVGVALVGEFSEVVAGAEHLLDFGICDGAGWSVCGAAGDEATVGEFIGDVLEGLVAGGIQFEGEFDERCAYGVDVDGADFTVVDDRRDVAVADRCAPERATVFGFLPHFVGDIGTIGPGSVFVEGSEHAVHELAFGGVVDVLGGGDQGDAAFLEVGHHDGVVDAAAGEAGEFVHDDVVDVALSSDAFQHVLESDAFRHLGGGLAGLDVFSDNGQPELLGFAPTGDTLGGNGDALRVIVGIDLAFGRDAQIDHSTAATRGVEIRC